MGQGRWGRRDPVKGKLRRNLAHCVRNVYACAPLDNESLSPPKLSIFNLGVKVQMTGFLIELCNIMEEA